ncbi:MAG: helix-turn-helix domain-containing protein [Clostridiales bacterium]|nr:helix-turn-helix domain-containing protein [Clostridiales bacterium]
MLYTVKEVSKILKSNQNYVYTLIKKGYLPALNLGSLKVRKESLIQFLEKYDKKDLSDLDNIKDLNLERKEVIDE